MEIKQTEQRTGKRILLAIDVQKGFERKECTLKNAEKIGELLRKELFDAVIATQFFNTKDSVYSKSAIYTCNHNHNFRCYRIHIHHIYENSYIL